MNKEIGCEDQSDVQVSSGVQVILFGCSFVGNHEDSTYSCHVVAS